MEKRETQVPQSQSIRLNMALLPFATNPLPVVAQLRDKYMADPSLSRADIEQRLNALKTLQLS